MKKLGALFSIFSIVLSFVASASYFVSPGFSLNLFGSSVVNRKTASIVKQSNEFQCKAEFFRLNSAKPEISEVKSFKFEPAAEGDRMELRGHILSKDEKYEIGFVALYRPKMKRHETAQIFVDAYLFDSNNHPLAWTSSRSQQVASLNAERFTQVQSTLNNSQIPGRIIANSASPLYVTEAAASAKGWVKNDTLVYSTLECRLAQ